MATAVGDIKGASNIKRSICLMTGQTSNTGAPPSATAGLNTYPDPNNYSSESGCFFAVEYPELSTLTIHSTAGSGTMVGTFTLWGYLNGPGQWFPIKVNGGTALAETSSDDIQYQEGFTRLGHFDRLYLDLEAVGGTATAFEAWLTTARKQGKG